MHFLQNEGLKNIIAYSVLIISKQPSLHLSFYLKQRAYKDSDIRVLYHHSYQTQNNQLQPNKTTQEARYIEHPYQTPI